MSKRTRPNFSPEFRLEVAQQVVDQGRTIRDVAESLGLGVSTVDKWARLDQRFSIIHEQQESQSIARLCRVLDVHRSSYRYWCKHPHKPTPQRLKLMAELKRWFAISQGSAGQRSLVTLLAQSDFNVSRWLVRKLMAQYRLGERHHVYPYLRRILVPSNGHRFVLSTSCWLVNGQKHR